MPHCWIATFDIAERRALPQALDRSVQGIIAVLLSLKKKPVIRYEKSSPMAKKLGVEVQVRMYLSLSP